MSDVWPYFPSPEEGEQMHLVDDWANGLEDVRGSGPDGLLTRLYSAWTAVAQCRPRSARSISLLRTEITRLSRNASRWQREQADILTWIKAITDGLRSDASQNNYTMESWSQYLDEHPAPQIPVRFDMMAALGPWVWWGIATGADAPPRSRQASGLVPESSENTTSDVAAVPSPAILIQDSEESDHVQPESKATPRPVAKTQRKGKAKAGDSKRMTPWGPPEMGGVDFNLNLQEAIENLEPGQLLSPGQVPPAIRAVQKASPASSERKQFACIAIAPGFAAQAMLLLSLPTSVVKVRHQEFLTREGSQQTTGKANQPQDEEPTRGRPAVRGSGLMSGARSRSRKPVAEDAMDEDSDPGANVASQQVPARRIGRPGAGGHRHHEHSLPTRSVSRAATGRTAPPNVPAIPNPMPVPVPVPSPVPVAEPSRPIPRRAAPVRSPASAVHLGTADGIWAGAAGTQLTRPANVPSPVTRDHPLSPSPSGGTVTIDQGIFQQLLNNHKGEVLGALQTQDHKLRQGVQDAVAKQYESTTASNSGTTLSSGMKQVAQSILKSSEAQVEAAVKASLGGMEQRIKDTISSSCLQLFTNNNQGIVDLLTKQLDGPDGSVHKAHCLIETQVQGVESLLRIQSASVSDLLKRVDDTHDEVKRILKEIKVIMEGIQNNTRGLEDAYEHITRLTTKAEDILGHLRMVAKARKVKARQASANLLPDIDSSPQEDVEMSFDKDDEDVMVQGTMIPSDIFGCSDNTNPISTHSTVGSAGTYEAPYAESPGVAMEGPGTAADEDGEESDGQGLSPVSSPLSKHSSPGPEDTTVSLAKDMELGEEDTASIVKRKRAESNAAESSAPKATPRPPRKSHRRDDPSSPPKTRSGMAGKCRALSSSAGHYPVLPSLPSSAGHYQVVPGIIQWCQALSSSAGAIK
ncbi:hypothetical protein BC826DRAFT_975825 [Russula brevipes]|nr:hypothetical protein BC826DRAFT_975825 [Russula brevipes]